MKKGWLLFFAVSVLTVNSSSAQISKWIEKGKKTVNENTGGTTGSGLTNNEIVAGLKQALEVGSNNAGNQLSALNGYFGNQLIKIIMPPEARKVESTLRSIGMGAEVDKAIMAMNRAAEDAAKKAAPIFINSIKKMSIQDGVSILKGGNGAATNYLKGRTTQELTTAFRPVIESSLAKVNATKYWSQVFTIYNRLPTTDNKINPDLSGYVTERALNGLFITVEQEENKIRQNPSARVTDLLRKVFG
jgi:hypothetical protein